MDRLITAKVLGERKYGDKDKVKIVVASRCSVEAYDNDGIDPNTQEDFTQEAIVACNNNLAKDDLVWISYIDEDKTQPIIISPYWGKTSSDTFGENAGEDPSDPTSDLLECGVTLADLAAVIVTYGEKSGTRYGETIKKLNKNVKKMVKDSWYADAGPADGKSICLRQWTGDSGRAQPVYKVLWKASGQKQGTGVLSKDSLSTIRKVISTSGAREAQWEICTTGKYNGKKVGHEVGQSFSDYIKQGIKGGIKDNACLLYYCDMKNQTPARGKKMEAGYKKGMKLKEFYQKVCLPIDSAANVPCPARRKAVYQNIKMMEDAGWLKGKAGNLTNVFNNGDGANETTGWVYPVSDSDGKFKVSKKWKYNNGIMLSHKNGKSEGKKAIAMYKGTVKKVETKGQSYTIGIEFRTKTNAKHYVEYCALNHKSVSKGDTVKKNSTIGTLNSGGLLIKVHKTKSAKSEYVNPSDYIGDNVFGSGGGFGGNYKKFTWYYQSHGYYWKPKNGYGSWVGNTSAAGCGIFSLAMNWTSFSGDKKSYIPPKISNNSGTGIGQKWGAIVAHGGLQGAISRQGVANATNKHKKTLKCTCKLHSGHPSLKTIKSVVSKGGTVMCCIHGSYGNGFTTSGHYFNITGLTKNNKMILADPGWATRTHYVYKDANGKGKSKGTIKGAKVAFSGSGDYYFTFLPYKG